MTKCPEIQTVPILMSLKTWYEESDDIVVGSSNVNSNANFVQSINYGKG